MSRLCIIVLLTLSIVGCQGFSSDNQTDILAKNSALTIAILVEDTQYLPSDLIQKLNVVTTNTSNIDLSSIDALLISRETLFSLGENESLNNRLQSTLVRNKVLLIHNTAPDEAARQLGLKLSGHMTSQTERYVVSSLAQLSNDTTFGGGILVPVAAPVKNNEIAQDIRSHLQEVINLQHRFSR